MERALAAAQTVPVRGDVDANLAQHERLVAAAANEGAALVVFPELSLTGYEMDLAARLAFSQHDPRIAPLAALAVQHEMTLVVGAPVRLAAQLHIGAFILTPDRAISIYTKQHLGAFSGAAAVDGVVPPPEGTVFQPGDMDPLITLGGLQAALAICADTARPTHARRAAMRGATAYLAGMFVIPSEFERETANLARYAREHGMTVLMANYGGASGGLAAAGCSSIWSPDGTLLARLGERGAGLVLARPTAGGWTGQTASLTQSQP